MAQAIAHGQSDALNNSASGINTLLDKIGAPSGQQVGGNIPAAGTALAGIQGLLPAQSWEKAGAAQASAADVLPATALLQGQENYKAIGAQGITAHTDFDSKIADLAGQLPGNIFDNYQKLQTAALDDAKFAEQVKNDQVNAAYKTAQQKLAVAKASNQVAEFNVTAGLKGQALTLQAQKLSQQIVTQDRNYQLSLQRLGLQTKSLQLRATALQIKYANGGFSPIQMVKLNGTANSIAGDAFTAAQATKGAKGTYQQAMETMQRNGIPLTIAQKALAQAGYRPGLLGTPTVHDQQALLADINYQTPYASVDQIQALPHGAAVQQIAAGAQSRGLDPKAVLAVASQEGLGGGVGDNGTSFGPFQLHIGGALPASVAAKGATYAEAWAWSPAGINYALDNIAKVAHGLSGASAIDAIVRRFERPLHPGNEVAGATAAYGC